MISYSKSSRLAIAKLMAPYNDIDIYVEDVTYVGIYEKIINRALRGQSRVQKVIPLGAKQDVLEAAFNDNESGGRPRLYIVDGDLDLIAHLRQRRATHLHRLKVYSLENLLFEERALEAYCTFACPGMSADQAGRAIDLPLVVKELELKASWYFVALAIARRLDLRDGVFAIDIKSIFATTGGRFTHVDEKKLGARLKAIVRRIRELASARDYRVAKAEILSGIQRRSLRGIDFVAGKSMLWYLNERAGHAKGQSLSQAVIASYLADHCTLARDTVLARRLRRVARGVAA